MGIEYIEIDVSAYAPRMQRTLLELNFLPVAYVPAMVFYQVERLDIVKMVRLNKLQDLGPLALTEPVQAVADVVMRGFSTCVIAPRMAQAIKEIPLFHGMNTEQATSLLEPAGCGTCGPASASLPARSGGPSLHPAAGASRHQRRNPSGHDRDRPHRGNVRRSLAPLGQPHSATATAEGPVEAAELLQRDLADLIRRRPDIGVIIYRNLAVGLGDKLLRSGIHEETKGWPNRKSYT